MIDLYRLSQISLNEIIEKHRLEVTVEENSMYTMLYYRRDKMKRLATFFANMGWLIEEKIIDNKLYLYAYLQARDTKKEKGRGITEKTEKKYYLSRASKKVSPKVKKKARRKTGSEPGPEKLYILEKSITSQSNQYYAFLSQIQGASRTNISGSMQLPSVHSVEWWLRGITT